MTLFAEEPAPAAVVICRRCKQPLTKRESKDRRAGDDCAEILGITTPAAPYARTRAGGDVPGQTDLTELEEM
ncbi:DUF6011 domain-containing protein [Streptosporangium canum]|uniref:DUF6011 domain-containing protein n=1 Tax=Streptosporangium canum TaxID=324952 RepID=UPI0034386C38